jgi:hypothetical protein
MKLIALIILALLANNVQGFCADVLAVKKPSFAYGVYRANEQYFAKRKMK